MTEKEKAGFRTIETDVEAMNQKIRVHKTKIMIVLLVLAVLIALALVGYYFYCKDKSYTDYMVQSRVERNDGTCTYEKLGRYILKYDNDGISCRDYSNNGIWNQAYEMQNPFCDIKGEYGVIADREGIKAFIFDTSGTTGTISASANIEQISISAQGTCALLLEENGTSYLQLYNKKGESLASGAIHLKNGSYPLNICISESGTKLGVSMLDISHGNVATTIAFYNFGSVGQNEIDNIVGSYTYDGKLVPEIFYVGDDKMVAVGDDVMITFTGSQRPEEKVVTELSGEITRVFHDDRYVGMVYEYEDRDSSVLNVMTFEGEKVLEKEINSNYKQLYFLENHEICQLSEATAYIYTTKGNLKFYYSFDDAIYKIFYNGGIRSYSFVLKDFTEHVILK